MLRPILAAAMGLVVTACAVPQQPTSSPGAGDWESGEGALGYDDRYRGLSAYIIPPEQGGLRFHVSRPAYVAMFEIIPNEGTRLIYPTPGAGRMDGFVFSGTRVPDTGDYWGRDGYAGGIYRGSVTAGQLDRPRFLFLIASERPLHIDEFGMYGAGLRAMLGHHYYASLNPYATMERIAEVALPTMADDGTWTTDMYVYWPQVLRHHRASRDLIMRCNGYTMYVAYEYAYHARQVLCEDRYRDRERYWGRERIPQRPRPPAEREDSTEIEQPGRRAPIPAEGEEIRRRLTSSRQLQQPQTRRPEERAAESERITGRAAEAEDEAGSPQEPTEPRRARPASQPETGARPASPRSVRPAPEPRAPRPVAETSTPPRGRTGAPDAEAGESPRPRATSGDPTPGRERPAPISRPSPASPPASAPRQSPAARPTPAPAPRPSPPPPPPAARPSPAPAPVTRPSPPPPPPAARPSPAPAPVTRPSPPPPPPSRPRPAATPAPRPAPSPAPPAARPSPPPVPEPARETGAEVPTTRRRGGGGGGAGD